MKLKHIFMSLVAAMAVFTSCTEEEFAKLESIQVSSSYVALPAEGGSTDITVNAKGDWAISGVPSWLTLSATEGTAGESIVTFSADATKASNSATVILKCGTETQRINVIQTTEAQEVPVSTCAQVIAGADGDTYRVKGTCTKIANTTYGNWYINDGTGEVYVYGTLDAAGGTKNFSSLGIEVGDIITVQGPKTTYGSTIELVDVSVVAIEKSLIKVDSMSLKELPIEGGEITVHLSNKGEGVSIDIPAAAQEWLSIVSIKPSGKSTDVTFRATANAKGNRSTELVFTTTKDGKEYTATTSILQKGAIEEVMCSDFNSREDGDAVYRVSGIISEVVKADKGNFYINDASGRIYVYGLNDGQFAAKGLKVGDIVTVEGTKSSFNGTAQMKNATYGSHTAVETVTVAEFKALEDDATKSKYYMISGVVSQPTEAGTKFDLETYGNFSIVDETGEIYIYGVTTGYNGERKKFNTLNVEENDTITILAYKTSYNGLAQGVGMFVSVVKAE